MRQILGIKGLNIIIQAATWEDDEKGRVYVHVYAVGDTRLIGAYEIDLEDVLHYNYDAIVTILRENGWVNPS